MGRPDEAVRRFTRRFPTFFGFLETAVYLIFTLTFPGVVVFSMMYVALLYSGIAGWLFGLVLLTPIIFLWYYRMDRRIRNYIILLQGQGKFKWNIDKAVNDYKQILEEQQKPKKKRRFF